ncbi:MmgE/PrpD family protein, partial [Bacillus sp. RAR_GA_16]|uniref:MmgE/PrpD family protein n=1 Tax=Bacillus sp. RAR_GA_16 TaxID=2876774 RepID=UPI001CCCD21A
QPLIGYEVFGKLGKALNPSHVYDRGFHPTGVIGAFASAATVSKLIGLTNEQIANALGIAGSMASGSLEFLQTGSWTKRLHPGWAAHNGIIAAELAKEGFTGPKTIIEGKNGFAKAYSMMFNPGDLTFDYSNHESFTLKTSIKPHACCRYKQGSLDIILDLVKTNDIKSEEVKEIKVYLGQTGLKIVGEPAVAKRNPQSSVDAQ